MGITEYAASCCTKDFSLPHIGAATAQTPDVYPPLTVTSDEPDKSGTDIGWVAIVVVATLFGALSLVGALFGLVRGDWWPAISGVLWVFVSLWFARGAWFRTRWSRRG